MNIAFDIGGVISKYPGQFAEIAYAVLRYDPERINDPLDCYYRGNQAYVITDMHPKEQVIETLKLNHLCPNPFREDRIYCADYATHGEFCKAILCKQLGIHVFIDDFGGYLQWDNSFGPAPLRLLVMPDGFKPYWAPDWKTKDDSDFGRRVYKQ